MSWSRVVAAARALTGCSTDPVPAVRPRLVGGCGVGRVDCGVAGHGRLIALTVPPGMRWPVPAGPLGLAVFFGEGTLRGPDRDRDLVEDDLLVCRVGSGLAVEASGSEELQAYLWGWPETRGPSRLPRYPDAVTGSARWSGDAVPALARSATGSSVVDGVGTVRVAGRTVPVTGGTVLHHGGREVRVLDAGAGGLALIGMWTAGGRPVLARRVLAGPG